MAFVKVERRDSMRRRFLHYLVSCIFARRRIYLFSGHFTSTLIGRSPPETV